MMRIVRFFFWGYVLMLVGVGASGMMIAPWELSKLFEVPLGTLSETAQAVAARLGSWLVDGQPRMPFLAFAVLELITGVLVSYAVTRLRARQPAQAA
jgi:hypothetical protein